MKESVRTGTGTQALDRGLDVLEVLSQEPEGLTPAGVAERIGLSRPTAYRILAALQRRGYVRTGPNSTYRLGFRLAELSSQLLGGLELLQESRPYLNDLLDAAQDTVHLTVREGAEIVYVDKVESSSQSIRMASRIGGRGPVHSTASGKAILSHLPDAEVRAILALRPMEARTSRTLTDPERYLEHLKEVRLQGYAVDNIENEEGVICLAAPVFDYAGRVLGAVSISGPAFRMTPDRLERLASALLEHTHRISKAMGWRGAITHD